MTKLTLKTERLTLRPLLATDAQSFVSFAGDADVARMTARIPHPYSLAQAEEWIGRATQASETVFAIVYQDALIGCTGYMAEDDGRAELGFWIGKPFWNRGFATEATRAVASRAFVCGEIHTLSAGHFMDNPASGRVLEKLGFTPTGTGTWPCVARGEEVPCMVFQLEQARLQLA
jgi:ribosomal-protein-alanine N-acetyltransferase